MRDVGSRSVDALYHAYQECPIEGVHAPQTIVRLEAAVALAALAALVVLAIAGA